VAETVIIPPGHGQNIAVRYYILPYLGYGYLINPQPQCDIALDTFGILINGVMDGTTRLLPYANFGKTPIKLLAGKVIGLLDRLETAPQNIDKEAKVYIGLAKVF
jgi:hypothetical protein